MSLQKLDKAYREGEGVSLTSLHTCNKLVIYTSNTEIDTSVIIPTMYTGFYLNCVCKCETWHKLRAHGNAYKTYATDCFCTMLLMVLGDSMWSRVDAEPDIRVIR